MKVLVAFASKHGGTAELAHEIGEVLASGGHERAVLSVDQVEGLDEYDAVILGSAVQFGRWLNEAARFLIDNQKGLAARPVWLFSSGPTGNPLQPAHATLGIGRLQAAISPRGHRIFGGKLDQSQLTFAEVVVVMSAGLPEGDFRDWAAVRDWAEQISNELQTLSL